MSPSETGVTASDVEMTPAARRRLRKTAMVDFADEAATEPRHAFTSDTAAAVYIRLRVGMEIYKS